MAWLVRNVYINIWRHLLQFRVGGSGLCCQSGKPGEQKSWECVWPLAVAIGYKRLCDQRKCGK
jgi:hypothetical protein